MLIYRKIRKCKQMYKSTNLSFWNCNDLVRFVVESVAWLKRLVLLTNMGGFFHGCFQRHNSDFTRFPYQYMKRPDCHCLLGFELVQIFAKYARVAWPNKYHEFKLPVEQAICPPDHPSVVYQPRLRSLLTTIQKVNDQCWWSQNIKNECFQLGSHKDSKWMAPISLLILYRKSNTTSLAKTTILFLKHWHLAIKQLRRWGTSLPPLAWPWDLLPKSMSTLNRSVMPAIKLRRLENLERTGFSGAPAAIEDMTSGKLTLC